MELRTVTTTAEIEALLASNALPTDDIDDPAIELIAAFDEQGLLGVVGLQRLADAALLRSLAVTTKARGRGIGSTLCQAAERRAGAADLWLLTTSAADYFARRGYRVIDRAAAPASLRATAQFTMLCPASAVVMCLDHSTPIAATPPR